MRAAVFEGLGTSRDPILASKERLLSTVISKLRALRGNLAGLLRRWLALVAFLLIAAAFGFDLWSLLAYRPPSYSATQPPPEKSFRGELSISQLRFDPGLRSFLAHLTLELTSFRSAEDAEIENVRFTLQNIAATGESSWLVYPHTWVANQGERRVGDRWLDSVELSREVVLEAASRDNAAVLFPFDRYRFRFTMDGCAGYASFARCSSDVETTGPFPIHLARADIEVVDPNFSISCSQRPGREGDDLTCWLYRRQFVRTATVAFLGLAVFFWVALYRIRDLGALLPRALGFFGALWGVRSFLIPRTLDVFPTVIDYTAMLIFLAIFGLISHRAYQRKSDGEEQ